MKPSLRAALSVLTCVCFLSACGGSSTPQVGVEGAGAALSSLFSGLGSNENVSSLIKTLDSSRLACNNLRAGPAKVLMFPSGAGRALTFGAVGDTITVNSDDFCADSDGDVLEGDATVGGERFAIFTLIDEITGICTGGDASDVTLARGGGILRNTDDYTPEIFGRFEIGGEPVDCTLRLDENGAILSDVSSCSTDDGTLLSLDSELTCTMDTASSRLAIPSTIPSTIKGHFGVTTDEGNNVAYPCWQITPFELDENSILSAASDCSIMADYGFNMEGFDIGMVVNADSEIFYTGNLDEMANRIKVAHVAGYPVLAFADIMYVADYEGDGDSVDDGADFPQAIIDDPDFLADLTQEILDLAEMFQALNVELFAPLAEADRVFTTSNNVNPEAAFLQSIREDIESRYTGALVWISADASSTDTDEFDYTGFDYAAINISPRPEHNDADAFLTHLRNQLTNLEATSDHFSIPYFITNAGMWGSSLDDSRMYDWDATPERVLETFTTMTEASADYGTAGIMYWEGATGEVVFEDYPALSAYIAEEFGGDPEAF